MLYFYIFLAIAIFIADWIYYSILDKEYKKNYMKYMKGNLEDYFEVRYNKKQYLIYIIMYIPAGMVFMELSKEAGVARWVYIGFAILFFTLPSMYYIYKSSEKIVYDHGEIKYYRGNSLKIGKSIHDIDKEQSFIYGIGEKESTRVSFLFFHSGEKLFFTRDSMDYGYKLEALMRKKNLAIDPELRNLEEFYAEDPDDEDALEDLKSARAKRGL